MKKNQIKKICKNCKLFNPEKSICSVVIINEGERIKIPVSPEDDCFFEGEYFDATTQAKESFSEEIKQVRFWVENELGEKTNGNGIVKIEYPEDFFGKSKKS
jgi:hypothetical protein